MDASPFEHTAAFAGFSVDDAERVAAFYRETLDLTVTETSMSGVAFIDLPGGSRVLMYAKAGHRPATFTVLNFPVPDIDAAVAELTRRGVEFLRYAGTPVETGEDGIFRGGGPPIAWFTDPAANVIAVLEETAAG